MSLPESRVRILELAEQCSFAEEVRPEDSSEFHRCTKIVSLVAELPSGLIALTGQGVNALLLHRASLAAKPDPKQTSEMPKRKLSLDARALAVFIEHKEWTKKEIAKHLECNEKSLAPRRCPKLDAAIGAYKSPLDSSRRVVRGTKDRDGNIDGYVEQTGR